MKIKELTLRNYKGFEKKQISFCNENGNVNDITLIMGNNGSGKSSILQAIALLLEPAVNALIKPSELDYPGFRWDNIQRGRMPVEIRASIQFLPEEIEATLAYAKTLNTKYPDRKLVLPSDSPEITIHLDYVADAIKSKKAANLFQTKGYQYALQLSSFTPSFNQLFDAVGGIYIYSETRNTISLNYAKYASFSNAFTDAEPKSSPIITDKIMKETLFKWYVFHQAVIDGRFQLREMQRDFFGELERLFKLVFPQRSFKGFAPKMMPNHLFENEQDFWLFDGKNDYEFAEMSGAERALFPILLDFANRTINNSIIIIDEIELHLHPALQQTLINLLPKLGKNNQFIITSHSDSVAMLFPSHKIIRL